jgi:hypothetical protein
MKWCVLRTIYPQPALPLVAIFFANCHFSLAFSGLSDMIVFAYTP